MDPNSSDSQEPKTQEVSPKETTDIETTLPTLNKGTIEKEKLIKPDK